MPGIVYNPPLTYANLRGPWKPNTFYSVDDQVTEAGTTWTCVTPHISGATFNTTNWTLAGFTSLTQTITTSQNVTAPIWATVADVTLIGGGGCGDAGQVATATAQANGGAGGGGGAIERHVISVTGGTVYPVTIGAGQTGPTTPGAAGGGGQTTFNGITVNGGGAGSSIGGGYGIAYKGSYFNMNSGLQGQYATFLGNGGSVNCPTVAGGINGVWGGQCGGNVAAAGTTGAGGGQAATSVPVTGPLEQTAASSTANGVSGVNATVWGCGGGGGGAAGVGGTGGDGGNGAPGVCIITWRSQ